MVARLPRWVFFGAFWLALSAGIVNIVGLLGFEHQAVTHLTGNTSLLGEAIAQGNASKAWHFAFLILSFVFGAMLSGIIIQDSSFRLGRRYSVSMTLVAAMLIAAAPLMSTHHNFGWYFAACACGLQNAMVTSYSGATVRTAHLTGMFTDLGIYVGHAVRGIKVDPRRIVISLIVISGFLLGGVIGAWLYSRISYGALYVPAGLSLAGAFGYTVLWLREKRLSASAK